MNTISISPVLLYLIATNSTSFIRFEWLVLGYVFVCYPQFSSQSSLQTLSCWKLSQSRVSQHAISYTVCTLTDSPMTNPEFGARNLEFSLGDSDEYILEIHDGNPTIVGMSAC